MDTGRVDPTTQMNLHPRTYTGFAAAVLFAAALNSVFVPARAADSAGSMLGVYEGAGCTGTRKLADFERWFGRRPPRVLDFIAWKDGRDGWNWVLGCWNTLGVQDLTISVPMLPGDGSGTLAQGAAGKFDAMFANLALDLVKRGFADATVRIGWEFNGDWYPWAASRDRASWITYWRRIVSIMRNAPGAAFKFDWCPAVGWTAVTAQDLYPGDEYVDYIGLDIYNITWDAKIVTPAQRWNEKMTTRNGLKWHRDFAASRGKPMSFPEWGTMTRFDGDGSGGGDDPYFIEQMAQWIASNNVAYHNYWDYKDRKYNSRLSDGSHPLAAEAFLRVFGGKTPTAPILVNPGRQQ
ncbi:MAG TPA: glycosyl hydrolase [Steroidobacteraceae bacterium]|nr:glycosyl hydrolase [Steroidobacteraceae bacterium]